MKRTGILTNIMGNMRRSWIPILIIPALVIAAVLLAYGPAGVGPAAAQDDSTSGTTTTPPAPKYPNLDATLQKIVAGYEAETWTETQAAQQAPEHHGAMVLIAVDVTATQADSVNTWMGTQEIAPRFLVGDRPSALYLRLCTKVSLLGALFGPDVESRRSGHMTTPEVDISDRPPQGVSGQDGGPPEAQITRDCSGYPYPKIIGRDSQKLVSSIYDNGKSSRLSKRRSYASFGKAHRRREQRSSGY